MSACISHGIFGCSTCIGHQQNLLREMQYAQQWSNAMQHQQMSSPWPSKHSNAALMQLQQQLGLPANQNTTQLDSLAVAAHQQSFLVPSYTALNADPPSTSSVGTNSFGPCTADYTGMLHHNSLSHQTLPMSGPRSIQPGCPTRNDWQFIPSGSVPNLTHTGFNAMLGTNESMSQSYMISHFQGFTYPDGQNPAKLTHRVYSGLASPPSTVASSDDALTLQIPAYMTCAQRREDVMVKSIKRESSSSACSNSEDSLSPFTTTSTSLKSEHEVESGPLSRLRNTKRVFATGEAGEPQCPQCLKCFKRDSNLRAHLECHDPSRIVPFTCEVPGCDKRFVRKADLRRHIDSVHLKLKVFECPHCGKWFSRKDTARRHLEDGCQIGRNLTRYRQTDSGCPEAVQTQILPQGCHPGLGNDHQVEYKPGQVCENDSDTDEEEDEDGNDRDCSSPQLVVNTPY